MTTVAIAIMAVLLAVLIGNTLPSFTVPAIKTLTKSKNGDSFRLAQAKSRMISSKITLSSGKAYIDECIEQNKEIDIRVLASPAEWESRARNGLVKAHEIEEKQYSNLVNLTNLSSTEREELFEVFLNKIEGLARDYIATKYGLEEKLNLYQKRKGYALTAFSPEKAIVSKSSLTKEQQKTWIDDYSQSTRKQL